MVTNHLCNLVMQLPSIPPNVDSVRLVFGNGFCSLALSNCAKLFTGGNSKQQPPPWAARRLSSRQTFQGQPRVGCRWHPRGHRAVHRTTLLFSWVYVCTVEALFCSTRGLGLGLIKLNGHFTPRCRTRTLRNRARTVHTDTRRPRPRV